MNSRPPASTVGRDIEDLKPFLAGFSKLQRSAFAASCATRALRLYGRHAAGEEWEDQEFMRSAVDRFWNALEPLDQNSEITEPFVSECKAHVPDEDDCQTSISMSAQSAAIVIAYAAESLLTGKASFAVGAASQLREAVETAVFLELFPSDSVVIQTRRSAGLVENEPLYAAEVDRQIRDILVLSQDAELTPETLRLIREQ